MASLAVTFHSRFRFKRGFTMELSRIFSRVVTRQPIYLQKRSRSNRIDDGDLIEVEKRDIQFRKDKSLKRNRKISDFSSSHECLYGVHPISSALKCNKRTFYSIYFKKSPNPSVKKILEKCSDLGLKVTECDDHLLSRIVPPDRPHQGIVAEVSKMDIKIISSFEEFFQYTPPSPQDLWIMPWEVHDPMNLGNIIRTAFFFGAKGCIMPNKSTCTVTPVVSKASSGAAELMDILRIKEPQDFLEQLRSNNSFVVGSCSQDSKGMKVIPINELVVPQNSPVFLLLGNEGSGLPEEVKLCCSALVSIPGNPADDIVESLNVTSAAAILMHKLSLAKRSSD